MQLVLVWMWGVQSASAPARLQRTTGLAAQLKLTRCKSVITDMVKILLAGVLKAHANKAASASRLLEHCQSTIKAHASVTGSQSQMAALEDSIHVPCKRHAL